MTFVHQPTEWEKKAQDKEFIKSLQLFCDKQLGKTSKILEAKDLRIGNIVLGASRELPHFVDSRIIGHLEKHRSGYIPMGLTEELLLLLGFRKFCKDFSKNGIIVHTRKRGFIIKKSVPEMKYVHQLQNYYFVNKGEELDTLKFQTKYLL